MTNYVNTSIRVHAVYSVKLVLKF